jgi:ubiquinone/menaquinone biosynthesis C-methylase UbiE
MGTTPKNTGFEDVDGSDNPQLFVRSLNEQYVKNSVLRTHKQHTLDQSDIQEGHIVLDAGCGIGIDAIQMAALVGKSGHVFGIDKSHEMIATAESNAAPFDLPLTFHTGSIYQIEFEDNYFDRCRSDKTFQHLTDPRAALKELIRVTKPGGKIIIADPDHDSLIIDTPLTDVNHRFVRFRSDRMPQGGIAHQLYGICKELGLQKVNIQPLTHAYTDYEEKKITSPYLEEIWFAQQQGAVTREEAEKWADYLQKAIENGRFMCMQTYIITTAFKPDTSVPSSG